jgi:hypothetical protein
MPIIKLYNNNKDEREGRRLLYYISSKQYLYIERIRIIIGRDKEED